MTSGRSVTRHGEVKLMSHKWGVSKSRGSWCNATYVPMTVALHALHVLANSHMTVT